MKSYYNPVTDIDENSDKNVEDILLEMNDILEYQDIISTHIFLNTFLALISLTSFESQYSYHYLSKYIQNQ